MAATTLASIFDRMSNQDVRPRTETVIKNFPMVLATLGAWPLLIPGIDRLVDVYGRFKDADDRAADDPIAAAQRNAIRSELNSVLTDMGDFIVLCSRADPTLLAKSGFDVRPPKRTASSRSQQLVAPKRFTVKRGTESGTLIGRASNVPGARSWEVHVCDGDPTNELSWRFHVVCGSGSKMYMPGFDPGKNVSLRTRAVGTNGVGPWSHIVTIMPV